MTIVLVALGSALGGVCRYLVSLALNGSGGFPYGTLAVNVVGSLAIGALTGWLAHGAENAAALRAFVVVGFCGGFTTFSTFSNETFRMLENGQFGQLSLYVALSLLAGLSAVALGAAFAR